MRAYSASPVDLPIKSRYGRWRPAVKSSYRRQYKKSARRLNRTLLVEELEAIAEDQKLAAEEEKREQALHAENDRLMNERYTDYIDYDWEDYLDDGWEHEYDEDKYYNQYDEKYDEYDQWDQEDRARFFDVEYYDWSVDPDFKPSHAPEVHPDRVPFNLGAWYRRKF